MLTGAYRPMQIKELAFNDWGLRTRKGLLSRSTIYKMLASPFYYGWFEYEGKLYKGKHEPMITEEEFNKAQILLGRAGRPRPKNHKFAFTGLIKCGECGASITAEEKIKYYKGTNRLANYIYYRCTKHKEPITCQQKPITETDLKKQTEETLKTFQIPECFKNWAIDYLRSVHEQEVTDRSSIYENLQGTYNDVQKKIDNLLDMRIRELISDNEYKIKKEGLLKEQRGLKEKLEDTENRASIWLELSEKTFNFAYDICNKFNFGTMEAKKSILLAIGSDFILKDGKLTIELYEPLRFIKDGLKKKEENIEKLEPQEWLVLPPQMMSLSLENPRWCTRRELNSHSQPSQGRALSS